MEEKKLTVYDTLILKYQSILNTEVNMGNYDFAKETYNNLKEKNNNLFLLTQNSNHGMSSGIINQMKSIKNIFILNKDRINRL